VAQAQVLDTVDLHRTHIRARQLRSRRCARQGADDELCQPVGRLTQQADVEPGQALEVEGEGLVDRKTDHHPGHRDGRHHRHDDELVERLIHGLESGRTAALAGSGNEPGQARGLHPAAGRMGSDRLAVEPDEQHLAGTDARAVILQRRRHGVAIGRLQGRAKPVVGRQHARRLRELVAALLEQAGEHAIAGLEQGPHLAERTAAPDVLEHEQATDLHRKQDQRSPGGDPPLQLPEAERHAHQGCAPITRVWRSSPLTRSGMRSTSLALPAQRGCQYSSS